jgi:hypothetical protein
MKFIVAALVAVLAACSPPSEKATQPPASDQPAPVAPAADSALAQVSSPTANATVTSPLHITGIAPANWYFENQFAVWLLDAQGNIIAQAAATPRVNWTENALPKEFDATLTFTATGPATIVLMQDTPRDDVAPQEVRVPVTLAR